MFNVRVYLACPNVFADQNYIFCLDLLLLRVKISRNQFAVEINQQSPGLGEAFGKFKFGVDDILLAAKHAQVLLVNAGNNADLGLDDLGHLADAAFVHRADLANKDLMLWLELIDNRLGNADLRVLVGLSF